MKKLLLRFIHCILVAGFMFLSVSNSAAQSPDADQQIALRLQTLTNGEKLLHWSGQADHTYFIQASDDLKNWTWAPNIEPGIAAPMSYEVDGPTAKGFFRLIRTPQTAADLDTADFDGDGLSNLYEITPRPRPGGVNGYAGLNPNIQTNPIVADTDGDLLNDKWELDHGQDPTDNGSRDVNNGALGDPDGDGLTNAEELAAGSHPQDSRPPIALFKRIDNADGTVTYSWLSFAYQGEWFQVETQQPDGSLKTIYATTYGSTKLPFIFGKQLYTLTLNPATDFIP